MKRDVASMQLNKVQRKVLLELAKTHGAEEVEDDSIQGRKTMTLRSQYNTITIQYLLVIVCSIITINIRRFVAYSEPTERDTVKSPV